MARGKIIVIEGSDKAGKTTQSRMLMESIKLAGKVCAVIDFPDYATPIGTEIKAFLEGKRDYPNEVKHLLFSANRWEKKKEIESMVENGTIVILNRYYQSNLVYGISNGLAASWLTGLEKGLPKEDLVIVLTVSPEVSTKRGSETPDSFESDQKFVAEVHKAYRRLGKQFGWKLVDGEKSKEQVHQEVMKLVRKVVKF